MKSISLLSLALVSGLCLFQALGAQVFVHKPTASTVLHDAKIVLIDAGHVAKETISDSLDKADECLEKANEAFQETRAGKGINKAIAKVTGTNVRVNINVVRNARNLAHWVSDSARSGVNKLRCSL